MGTRLYVLLHERLIVGNLKDISRMNLRPTAGGDYSIS